MKHYTTFKEFMDAAKKGEPHDDDWIGIMVPPGLTDEEYEEYIALFNAGYRRKVICKEDRE